MNTRIFTDATDHLCENNMNLGIQYPGYYPAVDGKFKFEPDWYDRDCCPLTFRCCMCIPAAPFFLVAGVCGVCCGKLVRQRTMAERSLNFLFGVMAWYRDTLCCCQCDSEGHP